MVNTPENRVAMALGSVGHLLMAKVAQNASLLVALSSLLTTELAEFCYFAALSLVIDTLFLWSFFAPVLTLDLKRYGMMDSIENSPLHHNDSSIEHGPPAQRQRGTLCYRRIVGIAAILNFLLMLTLEYPGPALRTHGKPSLTVPFGPTIPAYRDSYTLLSSRTKQTSDAANWLASQEHSTMKEILRLPTAGSTSFCFVARIYSPLIAMPKSANGDVSRYQCSSLHTQIGGYTQWLWALAVCCGLMLISGYFAYPTHREDDCDSQRSVNAPSINYLPHGHSLDIYLLSASQKPYLASVGFDHEIRYWDLGSCGNRTTSPITLPGLDGVWPGAAIAVDDRGEFVALCSKSGNVGIWSVKHRTGRTIPAVFSSSVALFSFLLSSTDGNPSSSLPSILLISTDGLLVGISTQTGSFTSQRISRKRIRASHLYSNRPMLPRLMSVTDDDDIYITVRRDGRWLTQPLNLSTLFLPQPSHVRLTPLPDLGMIGMAFDSYTSQLYLIDFLTGSY